MNPQKLSSHLSMSVWASTSFATLAHLFGESNCLEGTNETIIGGIHSHRTVKTLTCFSSSDCLYVGSMSGLLSPSKHSPHWKLHRGTAIMTSYDHCPLQTLSLMTWQLCKAHWVQQTPCLPKFTEPRLPEWRNLAKSHRRISSIRALSISPLLIFDFWDVFFGNLLHLNTYMAIWHMCHTSWRFPVSSRCKKTPPRKTASVSGDEVGLHPWEVTALYMFPYRGARWDFLTPSMTIRSMRLGKPWVTWQVVGCEHPSSYVSPPSHPPNSPETFVPHTLPPTEEQLFRRQGSVVQWVKPCVHLWKEPDPHTVLILRCRRCWLLRIWISVGGMKVITPEKVPYSI